MSTTIKIIGLKEWNSIDKEIEEAKAHILELSQKHKKCEGIRIECPNCGKRPLLKSCTLREDWKENYYSEIEYYGIYIQCSSCNKERRICRSNKSHDLLKKLYYQGHIKKHENNF